MQVERLDDGRVRALVAAPLTYREVGGSLADGLPVGYHHLDRTLVLGRGRALFDRAAADLRGWQVQSRAGLRVVASSDVVDGAVVVLGAGVGPLRLEAPCRVVATVDEQRAAGFAYGTLPGHPESGEESFVVRHGHDDLVTFTVRAFAEAAWPAARLAGPLAWALQSWVADRYLRALGRTIVERRDVPYVGRRPRMRQGEPRER